MTVTAASHPLFAKKAPWLMGKLLADFPIDGDDAAAIAGNAGHESLGFTKLQEMKPTVKGSRGGWGWFQWTGSRRKQFEAYCARHGYDPASDEANYKWLFIELSTTEAKAIPAVKAAQGLDAKVKAFEKAFERAGVKHYPARLEWAELALEAFRTTKSAPAKPAAPSVQTVPMPAKVKQPGIWSTLWGGLFGSAKAPVPTSPVKQRPGLALNGDAALYDQQEMLSDKGWTEVGKPDGLMGGKTLTAIRAFRAESGLPAGDTIDEKLIAALMASGPRMIAKSRADATVQDLREQGNSQVESFDAIAWLGKAIFGTSIAGGIAKSGVIEQASGTLQSMQDAFGTIATIFSMALTIINFLLSNLWLVGLIVGVWLFFKAVNGALDIVVKFRQGFLLRADK